MGLVEVVSTKIHQTGNPSDEFLEVLQKK